MNLEQKIGFDLVRSQVAAKCATAYARSKVEEEVISHSEEEILSRLLPTDEMRLICMFEDTFPSSGFIDARDFLIPLTSEYASLSLPSLVLLRTALDTLRRVVSFFRTSRDGVYPNLVKMTEPVAVFPEISRRIDTILDREGNVRDTASEALGQIRSALRAKEKSVSRSIQTILKKAQAEGLVEEGASAVVRDGKALIPVASAAKKHIAGIVYDESSSGKTSFIEPMEVVELNNQIRELQFEEQREIARILMEFTDFLRPYLEELIAGACYLGEIDFIRAKALVALEMKAGLPLISQNGELSLRKARHPLLEKALHKENKEIVPLTILLTREKHILLISGPNAGGKSVCLKTVGLLQYMFQWGLLIPTSEISEMTVFDNIFIDIGDDQSLENDLSTYSSFLSNMRDVVIRANRRSLVLIDEFGSGTEPAAGGAIAEAILAELDKVGAYGVITTHYTNLKLYANTSKGVMNGAMLFDVQAIAPLFKLEQGLPGNSFAFELARKIGLPEEIVKSAEERAGEEFVDMEKQLRRIAKGRRALEEKLSRVHSADKALEGLTDKYQKELGEIKALKKSILDQARAEAKEILAGANKQIEQTIREIRESQAEKEKTKLARKSLNEYAQSVELPADDDTDKKIEAKMEQIVARKERERKRREERARKAGVAAAEAEKTPKKSDEIEKGPLKVGDKVKIKESDLIGEITQISAKSVSVAIGAITSKMAPSKVERISRQQFKDRSRKAASAGYSGPVTDSSQVSYGSADVSSRRLNFSPSIDLRGFRLEEAITAVTHFIDDALMVGVGQVKILHGKGNGILREELRKYLKTMGGVVSMRDEALDQGGAGITVVELD